jgi:VCBS repeat-containing protein
MKTTNRNRNRLVTAKPRPLALEARIMFDGAGVDAALTARPSADAIAKDVSRVEQPALETRVPAADLVAAPRDAAPAEKALFDLQDIDPTLKDAAAAAAESIRNYLAAHPGDASLFQLFNGGEQAPSEQWLEAARALRQDVIDGRYAVQVIGVSGADIGGGFAAFAASGPGDKPAIFINRDWLASNPAPAAISRVLLEEFGHSLDAALNPGGDTRGDEGEAFAAAVLHFDLGDGDRMRIAGEDDRSTIFVDGTAYEVEEASFTFAGAYQGTPSSWSQEANQIANVTTIAGTRFKFTSADPSAPYFSGNNVAGTLSYVDNAGQVKTVDGVISRLFKTNGVVQGLFFYAWGNTTTIGDGGSTDPAEASYLLVLDASKFSAGGTYRTSSDPVDTALNKLIVPNSAPVAANDTVSVLEDGTLTGNVLSNDTDVNYDTLSVTGFKIGTGTGTLGQDQAIPGVGTLRVNSDGSYTFTPAANYTGPVPVITYTVSDGQATSSGRLTISITPVNDAPSGANKTVTIVEDTSYTFAASDFGFTDTTDNPANPLLAVKIATLPADGTLKLNGVAITVGQEIAAADITKLVYSPAANANGTSYASFTFQVHDGGGTANGGVDTDQTPNTITVNVTAQNDAPVGVPDTATAVEAGGTNNGTVGSNPTGNVLSNDTDIDAGDSKTVATASSSAQASTVVATNTAINGLYGTLTISSTGAYTYTVDNSNPTVQALRLTSNTLNETFNYQVKDAAGLMSSAALTVTIQGANDTPVAKADFASAVASTVTAAKVNPTGNVLTNDTDVDAGDSKVVTQASKGQTLSASPSDIGGSSSVQGDEAQTYQNNLTISGAAVGLTKVGDIVTGTGIPANTKISLVSGSGSTRTISFDTPSVLSVNQSLTITHANNGNTDSVTVSALGSPSSTVIALSNLNGTITSGMSITGTGIANGTTVSAISTSGDYTFVTLSQALSGSLGTNLVFSTNGGTSINGDHGTLVINADGSYAYTVTSTSLTSDGAPYFDYFTYKARDTAGMVSTATLKIQIDVSNTAPPTAVADSNSITENSTSILSTAATNVLNNDSGTSKSVNYAWAVNDSEMSSVTSGGINVAGLYGSLNIKSDGSYTYTLNNADTSVNALRAGQSLTDEFRYRMTASGGGIALSTLTITINGANDAPTGANDTAVAIEAGGIANASAGINPTGNVLSNDTDVEGDNLSVSAITGGAVGSAFAGSYGSLILNADGSFTYTVDNGNVAVEGLAPGASLTDNFTYTVSDGNGGTSTATLSITINGANDAPVNTLPGTSPTVAEGSPVALAGFSVSDADDASLQVQLSVLNGTLTVGNLNGATVSAGASGSLTLTLSGTKAQVNSALGTLEYQGATDFNGSDTLTMTSTDAAGLSDVDTLSITVTPDDRQ